MNTETFPPLSFRDGFQLTVGHAADPEGRPVAHIVSVPVEQFAWVRLFTAAPDLFAAIEALLKIMEHNAPGENEPAIAVAHHALAKAKGRP